MLPTSASVKEQWINEINSLLLSQAAQIRGESRNYQPVKLNERDLDERMRELAELGLGAKPYLNIEGSDAITDRSIQISS